MNDTNRIDETLSKAAPGLWPFLPAGYPSLEATAAMLRALNSLPIRGVELGIPFSDPIADGPVIQRAFSHALADGLRLSSVFDMAYSVRAEIDYPLLAMVSASIVYRLGIETFVKKLKTAGFDGLIVPDISLEEAPALATATQQFGMRLSMLIAPTTPPHRQERIAAVSSGFLYYVSVQGTTGARDRLPTDLEAHVRELKQATALPVLVGFGISQTAHVREVCGFADGAIVGSAIAGRITDLLEKGQSEADIVKEVIEIVSRLASD